MINGLIPSQGFELIRDQIGAILAAEFANQNALDNSYPNPTVFIERFLPIAQDENEVINVAFASAEPNSHDQKITDQSYLYNIDFYQKAKFTDVTRADSDSMIKLHKIMGMGRAILENSIYKTLGFAPPFVMNRRIISMQIADPGKQDTQNSTMGRLVLSVRVPEDHQLIGVGTLTTSQTTVKLELTEKGYLYIANT